MSRHFLEISFVFPWRMESHTVPSDGRGGRT